MQKNCHGLKETESRKEALQTGETKADDEKDRMPVQQANSRPADCASLDTSVITIDSETDTTASPIKSVVPATAEGTVKATSENEIRSIRVVSLDKLLRPSLVGTIDDARSSGSESENISQNYQSKNTSEEVVELVSSLKSTIAAKGTSVSSSSIDKKDRQNDATHKVKDLKVVITRLPENLSDIKARFKLKSIYDQNNVEIKKLAATTENSSVRAGTKRNIGLLKGGNEMQSDDAVLPVDQKRDNQERTNEMNSDSDEPLRKTSSKPNNNIPKRRKVNRRRRAVSDSDEENTGDKKSPATVEATNGNGSDESDKGSDGDIEFSTRNTASGRSKRASERLKRTAERTEDGEKSGEGEQNDGGGKNDFQPRKKRTRIRKNTSSSSDEDSSSGAKRKKRKNNKKKKANDESDEGDSPTKGRKNIRKLLKKSDLEQTTKNAEQEERERKQRIAERQKLYNQVYDEKPEEARTLDQLVLDFDEETKEPLLEVDKKLVKQLKPHQANGIKFMFDACFESLERMKDSRGSGCILAHCMGLGKTLQVVTLAHTLLTNSDVTGVERILVVCPLSTVLNWANEFNIWMKHVKKGTEVEVYEISRYKDNPTRANKLMEWHNEGGVMILGYDMFRNLANAQTSRIRKKVRESLQTSLIDPGPELIVCDEGHLLKNEKTSLSQVINRISTLRRIVLTGTPIQNNMKEYYCMVQFVKPKLLGTYQEYMNRFVNPITNGQYTDSTPFDIQLMRKRAHVLHKLLDGCVQRRDYSVLAPFLPPKLEFVVSIKLTPLQCTLYKHYMENFAGKRIEDDPTQKRSSLLFVDFQNLQRIWTHPRVLRYNSDRYEIVKQKKRDLESESEGSMKDFLDDESEESAESTPDSSGSESDDDDVQIIKSGDESSNDFDKAEKNPVATRRTRKNRIAVAVAVEEEEKPENPTEWWMQMCPETELDKLEHSGKLMMLMEILKECEMIGDKLLVFSQSLYSLDVIEHFLMLLDENTQKDEADRDETLNKYPGSWAQGLDYFRLDGSTAIDNRNEACKYFNDESNTRARLFLISTRAGGLGINLVAANRVVIFDVSWNPSHDIQSIFRVYRFGQNKPCYIYRFVAMGTMEEKIYERQVTKQAISKRVIDEQQIDRHYKENDLQELYRYDVDPSEPRPTPNLPKDRLFAELLRRFDSIIYKYHEHDSLLENKEEETLNEEERKAAWEEFEQEKNRPPMPAYGAMGIGMGMNMGMVGVAGMPGRINGPVTSSNTFGFRNDVLLKLLNIKVREDSPALNDATVNAMIPYMMQELTRQMKNGELTLYRSLCDLYYKLEVPAANQHYPVGFAPPGTVGVPPTAQGVVQPPIMAGQGSENMMYNMYTDQTGIARASFASNVPMQQPSSSGIQMVGGPVVPPSTSGNVPQYIIDPEVVELD